MSTPLILVSAIPIHMWTVFVYMSVLPPDASTEQSDAWKSRSDITDVGSVIRFLYLETSIPCVDISTTLIEVSTALILTSTRYISGHDMMFLSVNSILPDVVITILREVFYFSCCSLVDTNNLTSLAIKGEFSRAPVPISSSLRTFSWKLKLTKACAPKLELGSERKRGILAIRPSPLDFTRGPDRGSVSEPGPRAKSRGEGLGGKAAQEREKRRFCSFLNAA